MYLVCCSANHVHVSPKELELYKVTRGGGLGLGFLPPEEA